MHHTRENKCKEKMSYRKFIATKQARPLFDGLPEAKMPKGAFPHQKALTNWGLRKGRAAIFADTGLGKTLMELAWARRVSDRGRVLILTPLAVAQQIVREGDTWGVPCKYLRKDDGKTKLVVSNYEMLEHFNVEDFIGIVLDESSILKSFTGKMRNALINAFQNTPYRLAATATPAPNDFTEIGNHSEFLGVKTRTEMLSEFFVHDMANTQDWRLKKHALEDFWRWVASWAAVIRSPAALGFDASMYALPPLRMIEHVVEAPHRDGSGLLFPEEARTLSAQRRVRRDTLEQRVRKAAEICERAPKGDSIIIWCEGNQESKRTTAAIKGTIEVEGSQDPDEKAKRLLGFINGEHRVLVTKPKIAGFGLNLQLSHEMIFFGASHSYEQTYQAIRRAWRFGQTKPVDVHMIRADVDNHVIQNYRRKEADAARMASIMESYIKESVMSEVLGSSCKEWDDYSPSVPMTVPQWLKSESQ